MSAHPTRPPMPPAPGRFIAEYDRIGKALLHPPGKEWGEHRTKAFVERCRADHGAFQSRVLAALVAVLFEVAGAKGLARALVIAMHMSGKAKEPDIERLTEDYARAFSREGR